MPTYKERYKTYEKRYKRLSELEKKKAEIEKKHADGLKKANGRIVRAGQLPPEVRAYLKDLTPVTNEIAEVRGTDPGFLEYYKRRKKAEMQSAINAIKEAGAGRK